MAKPEIVLPGGVKKRRRRASLPLVGACVGVALGAAGLALALLLATTPSTFRIATEAQVEELIEQRVEEQLGDPETVLGRLNQQVDFVTEDFGDALVVLRAECTATVIEGANETFTEDCDNLPGPFFTNDYSPFDRP